MSAVRGCDSVPREDMMKQVTRFYRACVLRSHCGDPRQASSFIVWYESADEFWGIAGPALKSIDHYPTHWLLHMLHAAEILGYKMPGIQRYWWLDFYGRLVKKLHLNPESEAQLDARLDADEVTFKALQ